MISFIDHVAVAVRDFDRARDFFTRIFGARPEVYATDQKMGYIWHTFSLGSLSRFELVAPRGSESFLDNFLSDREGGVHHITMRTDSIVKARQVLEKNRVPFFGYNDNSPHWKELFVHPRDAFGVLIQIAEFDPVEWMSEGSKLPGGKKFALEKTREGAILRLAHPAGGIVEISLDTEEIGTLNRELHKLIEG